MYLINLELDKKNVLSNNSALVNSSENINQILINLFGVLNDDFHQLLRLLPFHGIKHLFKHIELKVFLEKNRILCNLIDVHSFIRIIFLFNELSKNVVFKNI